MKPNERPPDTPEILVRSIPLSAKGVGPKNSTIIAPIEQLTGRTCMAEALQKIGARAQKRL